MKNSDSTKSWQGYGETGFLVHWECVVGMGNDTNHSGK